MEQVGTAASTSSKSTVTAEVVLTLAMKGSLNQIWSMINSQQIIVHLPMLQHLKIPANAMLLTSFMIELAQFDIIPT